MFILVKILSVFKRKKVEEPAPAEEPAPDPQIVLLTEIRDLLKNGGETSEEETEKEADKATV